MHCSKQLRKPLWKCGSNYCNFSAAAAVVVAHKTALSPKTMPQSGWLQSPFDWKQNQSTNPKAPESMRRLNSSTAAIRSGHKSVPVLLASEFRHLLCSNLCSAAKCTIHNTAKHYKAVVFGSHFMAHLPSSRKMCSRNKTRRKRNIMESNWHWFFLPENCVDIGFFGLLCMLDWLFCNNARERENVLLEYFRRPVKVIALFCAKDAWDARVEDAWILVAYIITISAFSGATSSVITVPGFHQQVTMIKVPESLAVDVSMQHSIKKP